MPTNQNDKKLESLALQVQSLSEDVGKVDLRQQEVFQPALKGIQTDVKTLIQRDYITKVDAKDMFATKDEVKAIKDAQAKRDKYWFTFASAVIGILTLAAYNLLTSGVIK